MPFPRRIFAVRSRDGRSRIVSDGRPAHIFSPQETPGITITELWHGQGIPKISEPVNPDLEAQPALLPDAGSMRFRLVAHEPGARMAMHQTDTVDVVVILSGELWLEVEGCDVITLKPGDSVVQVGARHAWENRGKEPCVAAVFLLGAEP